MEAVSRQTGLSRLVAAPADSWSLFRLTCFSTSASESAMVSVLSLLCLLFKQTKTQPRLLRMVNTEICGIRDYGGFHVTARSITESYVIVAHAHVETARLLCETAGTGGQAEQQSYNETTIIGRKVVLETRHNSGCACLTRFRILTQVSA